MRSEVRPGWASVVATGEATRGLNVKADTAVVAKREAMLRPNQSADTVIVARSEETKQLWVP